MADQPSSPIRFCVNPALWFRLELLPLNAMQRERMFRELALGWSPAERSSQSQLDAAALSQLARLDQLTPGGFPMGSNACARYNSI